MQTISAGVDKLPLQELARRNVILTNARGVHTIQMSEFTLSLMLQWVRKANLLHECQQSKVWDNQVSFDELYGKTIGIIGAGAIGEAVARKAKAFDMTVIGLNRSGSPRASLRFDGQRRRRFNVLCFHKVISSFFYFLAQLKREAS